MKHVSVDATLYDWYCDHLENIAEIDYNYYIAVRR